MRSSTTEGRSLHMGDGIMAVFGAPIEMAVTPIAPGRSPRDAPLAPAGVQPMAEGEGSRRRLRMGIGLSSGPIMSGTVGSERRLEYTTVGDTNTASRLEAMTKNTPYSIYR